MNEATRRFVLEHRMEDVRQLALKGSRTAEVDMSFALRQIAGWQMARRKLPSWAAVDDIIYPPHLNMEQCSSEQTARYKAQLVRCWLTGDRCWRFVDLTGGFGVDFYFMAKAISPHYPSPITHHLTYVERNAELCELARHNFPLLGLEAEIVCGESADYLARMPHSNVIFLDPARRDEHGSRTYGIEDCTPNVIELLPLLMEKADTIILKLSPMLDWRKAVNDLHHSSPNTHHPVSEVHIVSVDNECKELLMVISSTPSISGRLVCVNNDTVFETVFCRTAGSSSLGDPCLSAEESVAFSDGTIGFPYLYEPNASIMKAGCFKEVGEKFGVSQLSVNSHLFVSDHEVRDFPGRQFCVETVSSMNKQELKEALKDICRANVAVRNFPMSAEALRKKLKLKDGGDVFLFGTTLTDGSHKLLVCRKIG